MEKYIISQKEINRRITAFSTLIVSLIIGTVFSLYDLWIQNFYLCLILTITLTIVFFTFRVLVFHFFDSFQSTKLYLSDHYLERKRPGFSEKIALSQIRNISIRRTIKGHIRDIIIRSDKKIIALDGLENFKQFSEALSNKCKNAPVMESSEHLDYDHPFFYAILGLLISSIAVYVSRLVINSAEDTLNIIYLSISTYSEAIGIFFLFGQPIAKRYGNKIPLSDLIFGIILVIAGISIYYLGTR